ncbi:MAG: aKG-HExxH-type peptide beta-hydroxylase [Sphingobacteriales bacterium]
MVWKKKPYTADNYSTVNALFNTTKYSVRHERVNSFCDVDTIGLEHFPAGYLTNFYQEHGLTPIPHGSITTLSAITKLEMAFTTLSYVPEACKDAALLIRRIQLLHTEDDEIDTSYSHPEIPFTIFVSLCRENSGVADLRLAESILHEAMHLKLTLIEQHLKLIVPDTTSTFYSPWREEQRPVQGLLHAIFVFKAMYDFYERIKKMLTEGKCLAYVSFRQSDILAEFTRVTDFPKSVGLTAYGASFAANLLPLS